MNVIVCTHTKSSYVLIGSWVCSLYLKNCNSLLIYLRIVCLWTRFIFITWGVGRIWVLMSLSAVTLKAWDDDKWQNGVACGRTGRFLSGSHFIMLIIFKNRDFWENKIKWIGTSNTKTFYSPLLFLVLWCWNKGQLGR